MRARAVSLPGTTPRPSSRVRLAQVAKPASSFGYKVAFALWMTYMFEPHWWVLETFRLQPAGKITVLLSATLLAALVARFQFDSVFLPSFAVLCAYVIATYPVALNPAYAFEPAKQMGLYYLLGLGLATFVKTPRQLVPLLGALMLWQFVWWGLWGVKSGLVWWHPLAGNYDGYGPVVALGVGGAFHYGMAARNPKIRYIGFATALLCVLCLVSTFARGAFLGLLAVLGWMWLRSPRKGVMTLFGVGAVLGIVLGAAIFTGGEQRGRGETASFFDEMKTIISETEEGTGTTGDRKVLWGAATEVFKQHPVFGAGGNNVGVAAAGYFATRDIGGDYGLNPAMLYDRKLHSIFFQIIAEYGTVGTLLYLWVFIDFFRRNNRLRSPEFVAAWEARGGGAVDLRWISLGLAAMMIGYLTNGVFYNLLEATLLATLVMMNGLVYKLADPAPGVVRPRRGGQRAVATA